MYQKEIIYISLYENEVKQGCVGYLKTETKQDKSQLELQVKNIPQTFTGSFPIRIQNKTGWQETGMLTVKEGSGKWTGSMPEELLKVEILLSTSCRIKGESRKEKSVGEVPRQAEKQAGEEKREHQRQQQSVERSNEQEKAEREKQEKAEQKRAEQEKAEQGKTEQRKAEQESAEEEKMKQENAVQKKKEWDSTEQRKEERENAEQKKWEWESEEQMNIAYNEEVAENEPAKEEDRKKQTVIKAESMAAPALQRHPPRLQTATKSIRMGSRQEHKPLFENKWEQILSTYEQIHPYGDNRVYVKLEPKDFIVLRENYQHLVNNSFLLHGFYNYRYLILGREKDFYLGVPGVFYEREKMVALMFGFEAFECEGGEAEEGKFGYYLRKVEL